MAGICEEIIAAIDIADVIGERVRLRPARRGYSGLCPFHEDSEPSFHVYTDTQSYYCFGCQEAGNVITYVMKTENVGFPEALRMLADRAGIDLPEKRQGGRSAYEILGLTAKFYADTLAKSSGAQVYLGRRKLDRSDMLIFSLGFAYSSWDMLVRYLREEKVPDKQMLDLGLALTGKHGLYDKFRGRVIFPIKDIVGRVIGFGGRSIDGNGAKYINSSESEIYRKRKNLYLLDRAKSAIHAKKRSILVEGYMDAIRLHKNGYTEAVASLGTSLTEEQAVILSRLADRCYICYDSDTAGQKATLRSMYALQREGLDVYVINLPDSKDPDEYLSEHSAEEFEEAVRQARPLIEQHLVLCGPQLSDKLTRKSAMRELFGSLSELEEQEVLEYRRQISEATGIAPSLIEERILSKREHPEERIEPSERKDPATMEAGLCRLLQKHREYRQKLTVEEVLKLIKEETAQKAALALLTENVDVLMERWTALGDTKMLGVFEVGEEYCSRMNDLDECGKWEKTYGMLRERYVRERIAEIESKMQKSEATAEDFTELVKLKGESR